MTQAQAKTACRLLDFSFRKTQSGDFRIMPHGGTEAQAYYTDDISDAVDTAKAEAARSKS